jgi:heme exporter protein D
MSGAAWGFAIWVSAYEPLVLSLIVLVTSFLLNPRALFGRDRRTGWILLAVIIAAALLIERRMPSFAILQSSAIFKNWASTIGELAHVSPANPVWIHWCGYLVLVAPFLIWISIRTRKDRAQWRHVLPIYVLLIVTFFLTIWQARWAYFFVLIFALALPALLAPIKSATAVWIAFVLSIFPVLRDWDETLWPNEAKLASRVEKRIESAQIRDVALMLDSSQSQPFLAPWWLSPSIAYWSGQPGVAGSAHEGLKGIEDSARFFLSNDLQQARSILHKDNVAWVFAYDSQRVTQNSAALLKEAVPAGPLCRVLDRTPGHAPPFLIFSAQTPACKLYRVSIER